MKILLFLSSVLAFLAGLGILVASKSAIHEIEGFVLFIVSAVLFSGAVIVEAIERLGKKFKGSEPTAKTHKICPDCKEYVQKDARVCKHCGYKSASIAKEMAQDPNTKTCGSCNRLVSGEEKFCPVCGYNLAEGSIS